MYYFSKYAANLKWIIPVEAHPAPSEGSRSLLGSDIRLLKMPSIITDGGRNLTRGAKW
jgi:hypothetical protein